MKSKGIFEKMRKSCLAIIALITVSVFANDMQVCLWCNGTAKGKEWGFVKCSFCQGKRFQNRLCFSCGGTGIFKGSLYLQQPLPCPVCFGNKYMPCYACGMSGVTRGWVATHHCNVCKGKKMVPASVNMRVVRAMEIMTGIQLQQTQQRLNSGFGSNSNRHRGGTSGMTCSLCRGTGWDLTKNWGLGGFDRRAPIEYCNICGSEDYRHYHTKRCASCGGSGKRP